MDDVLKISHVTARISYNDKRYLAKKAREQGRSIGSVLRNLIAQERVRDAQEKRLDEARKILNGD